MELRVLGSWGLVWRWLLQKWTEITEALQKFSFYWRFACWGSWRSLVWVGEALQKHFLLRSKSGFWFRSLVGVGLVLCWFITEMNRNYRSITEILFLLEVCLLGVLEGDCIGWMIITEIIRCRSSFATARKRKQAFFLLALNRKSLASLEIWVLV